MSDKILRHGHPSDTAANWKKNNPIIGKGEIAIEAKTNKIKIGNGIDKYTDLDYTNLPILYGRLNTTDNCYSIDLYPDDQSKAFLAMFEHDDEKSNYIKLYAPDYTYTVTAPTSFGSDGTGIGTISVTVKDTGYFKAPSVSTNMTQICVRYTLDGKEELYNMIAGMGQSEKNINFTTSNTNPVVKITDVYFLEPFQEISLLSNTLYLCYYSDLYSNYSFVNLEIIFDLFNNISSNKSNKSINLQNRYSAINANDTSLSIETLTALNIHSLNYKGTWCSSISVPGSAITIINEDGFGANTLDKILDSKLDKTDITEINTIDDFTEDTYSNKYIKIKSSDFYFPENTNITFSKCTIINLNSNSNLNFNNSTVSFNNCTLYHINVDVLGTKSATFNECDFYNCSFNLGGTNTIIKDSNFNNCYLMYNGNTQLQGRINFNASEIYFNLGEFTLTDNTYITFTGSEINKSDDYSSDYYFLYSGTSKAKIVSINCILPNDTLLCQSGITYKNI